MEIHGILLGWLLFPTFLAGSFQAGVQNNQSLPADFKITAEFERRIGFAKSWRTTIAVDGTATQETMGQPRSQRIDSKLADTDLRRLFVVIRDAEFFAMKKQYLNPTWDRCSVYTLTVSANNKTHKVSVDTWNIIVGSDEVKRFMKVLNEVTKRIPSPNSKPEPEWKDWIARDLEGPKS